MLPAIRIENLGKCYRIGQNPTRSRYRTIRETLVDSTRSAITSLRRGERSRSQEFWALKDLDLEIPQGEIVGIIGHNGAGKSTLLKILSRITRPSRGRVALSGRVGSLLEVGTGFHPELTGRENIYLNGSILGMNRHEIARKFDEIVDFAEVHQFLDVPVKRYSSGMYVRLAFAVAAHLEPEILLVDEVLAVGDQSFQKKCAGKMGMVASSGRTIVLVSHNLHMLTRLSTIAVWLERGEIKGVGDPQELANEYATNVSPGRGGSGRIDLIAHPGREAKSVQLLESILLSDENGTVTNSIPLGGSVVIEVSFSPAVRRPDITLLIEVCDPFGTILAQIHSWVVSSLDLSTANHNRVKCIIDDLRLLPGEYQINVALGDREDYLDRIDRAVGLTVTSHDLYGSGFAPTGKVGLIAMNARWETSPD